MWQTIIDIGALLGSIMLICLFVIITFGVIYIAIRTGIDILSNKNTDPKE